ncbi:MAG: WD40-repeat-containing domain protein [Benjaminiella poitrasii]|nr:MAG: WD40-repeat-containing domain protein [Benjaminiella poitrasii]
MDFFLHSEDISSPPSTPPQLTCHDNRRHQRPRSSYMLETHGDSLMDKVRLDYMGRVKSTFQQLTLQQRHFFLTELLSCCDNQLLQYIYTFITPKLKIDFLQQLPIELALHVISFLDDARTLVRASHVSRHWHSLLKDEQAWRALCLKHHYYRTIAAAAAPSPHMLHYRDLFRRQYYREAAWDQGRGGRLTLCEDGHLVGLATSLQMDDCYVVVGCDNNRVEVFDARSGRHLRSLLGHEGGVWALEFIITNQQEHLLVTGGCDRAARVWNLDTGELRHVLRGHVSTIRCLKIVAKNNRLRAVTGSRDMTLRVWDIERGQVEHVCTGHQSSVRCIDVHGTLVASGSYDTTARLWDLETGVCLHNLIGHHSQIYSIVLDAQRVVTGSLDSNIRVWSVATGDCLATLRGHTSLVGHLQLMGDRLVSGGSDGCLRIWDLARNECKHRISAHDNSVTCLQFDEKRILSGGSDGRVKLWDVEKGSLIRSFTQTARTVWKLQMLESKAVVILEREVEHPIEDESQNNTRNYQAVIELYDFDLSEEDKEHGNEDDELCDITK